MQRPEAGATPSDARHDRQRAASVAEQRAMACTLWPCRCSVSIALPTCVFVASPVSSRCWCARARCGQHDRRAADHHVPRRRASRRDLVRTWSLRLGDPITARWSSCGRTADLCCHAASRCRCNLTKHKKKKPDLQQRPVLSPHCSAAGGSASPPSVLHVEISARTPP